MASQKLAAFERALSVNRTKLIGEAHRQAFIGYAREKLAETLNDQRARSGAAPSYEQRVDGRLGAPLESVKLGGVIRFDFRYLQEIAQFALDFAREHSPVQSGEYRKAWFVMVDGKKADPSEIGAATQIIIANDKPYHRKIELGAMQLSVPPGIAEQTRQAVQRRYGNVVQAEVRFVQLVGGYRLVRGYTSISKNRTKRRHPAGEEMTYPAVEITVRG